MLRSSPGDADGATARYPGYRDPREESWKPVPRSETNVW